MDPVQGYYVTRFIKELRVGLKEKNPRALLTGTVIAREGDGYLKALQDWPSRVNQGLIDEFYLWFRTTDSLKEVETHTRHASNLINGRCPLVVELSWYHPGSFQEPRLMLEAARRTKASGASAVGVYRSEAVEQLGFWPVLEQIAKL